MRASVLFEQGKPLQVEELDLEAPREGEALVRMTASGVCPSCLHAAAGRFLQKERPEDVEQRRRKGQQEVGHGIWRL